MKTDIIQNLLEFDDTFDSWNFGIFSTFLTIFPFKIWAITYNIHLFRPRKYLILQKFGKRLKNYTAQKIRMMNGKYGNRIVEMRLSRLMFFFLFLFIFTKSLNSSIYIFRCDMNMCGVIMGQNILYFIDFISATCRIQLYMDIKYMLWVHDIKAYGGFSNLFDFGLDSVVSVLPLCACKMV